MAIVVVGPGQKRTTIGLFLSSQQSWFGWAHHDILWLGRSSFGGAMDEIIFGGDQDETV